MASMVFRSVDSRRSLLFSSLENIFVSALLQPDGLPAAVFLMALSGEIQMCVMGNWIKPVAQRHA